MKTLITTTLILLLCSCNTTKRAERQQFKILLYHPEVAANMVRTRFPCITTASIVTTDSSAYNKWKDSVNILNEFYNDLQANLKPVIIHDTTVKECTDYRYNEAVYKQQLVYKNKLIQGLNNQIATVQPIRDSIKFYIEDSSKIYLQSKIITTQENSLKIWKKLSIWLGVLAVGLGIFIFIRKK